MKLKQRRRCTTNNIRVKFLIILVLIGLRAQHVMRVFAYFFLYLYLTYFTERDVASALENSLLVSVLNILSRSLKYILIIWVKIQTLSTSVKPVHLRCCALNPLNFLRMTRLFTMFSCLAHLLSLFRDTLV